MRLTFDDIKRLVAERFGEPELSGPIEGTFDLPWVDESDLERIALRVVRDILREVPRNELETYGRNSGGGAFPKMRDGMQWPTNVLRVISAYVTSYPGVMVNLGPAEPVSEAAWFQRSQNDDNNFVWSVIGGNLRMRAPQINFGFVIEPPVQILREDGVILPQGSDRELIDRIVQWLKFSRDMEVGRA